MVSRDLMLVILISVILLVQHVASEDICRMIQCGTGRCIETQNPIVPYYCQCPNGSNSILPCSFDNPCSSNPCGHGICEVVPTLPHGYLCRCLDETLSINGCNGTSHSCRTSPCFNGLCRENGPGFSCDCLPTWRGQLCQDKVPSACLRNPCGAGKCFTIDDPSVSYVCLCPNAKFDKSCSDQETLPFGTTRSSSACDPLDEGSCGNHGRCLFTGTGFQCLCLQGYSGRACDFPINACASNPCHHDGFCHELASSYICACPDGSFRPQCPAPTASIVPTHNPGCRCQNGGVCSLTESQMCTCPSGFTGQFCEIEYFHCLSNGRFTDRYNCPQGKYFECVHAEDTGSNRKGTLLSRDCPRKLRFNVLNDRCDYPEQVHCPEA